MKDLREAVAQKLLAPKGVQADPEDIMIVSGGLETMNLICQVFLDPGDVILVESPTFVHCAEIFEMFQAKCIAVDMDEHGIIPEEVEKKIQEYHPKMVYVIPTFHNPTGRTLTTERRKELVKTIKKMGEDAKVAERNNRREAMEAIKKLKTAKTISEDEAALCEKDVEKAVAECMAKLEEVIAAKEKEIMTV